MRHTQIYQSERLGVTWATFLQPLMLQHSPLNDLDSRCPTAPMSFPTRGTRAPATTGVSIGSRFTAGTTKGAESGKTLSATKHFQFGAAYISCAGWLGQHRKMKMICVLLLCPENTSVDRPVYVNEYEYRIKVNQTPSNFLTPNSSSFVPVRPRFLRFMGTFERRKMRSASNLLAPPK